MNAIPTLIGVLMMGATNEPRKKLLNRKPGIYAVSHDVYFGIDVNEARRNNSFDILGSIGLEDKTYYPPTLL